MNNNIKLFSKEWWNDQLQLIETEHIHDINEMRIVPTPKNHLSKLKEIKAKIKSKSTSIEEKKRLALEVAKLVLPIWEVYYKDDRPRLAIQIAEECLNNPTEENRKKAKEAADAVATAADAVYIAANVTYAAAYAAYSAAYVAYAAYAVDAVYYASTVYAVYVTDYAIEATKGFFKIKKSLNENLTQNQIQQFIELLKKNIQFIKGPYKISIQQILNDPSQYESLVNSLLMQMRDNYEDSERVFGKELTNLAIELNGDKGKEQEYFKQFKQQHGLDELKISPSGKEEIYSDLKEEIKKDKNFDFTNHIRKFVKFCIKELQLKKFNCKIILTKDKSKTQTYAYFDPNNDKIVVYIKERSLGDICRSLCHELVHYKQKINNNLTFNSGETGSDQENEANSLAGIIMRKWGKIHPEIFIQTLNEMRIVSAPKNHLPKLEEIKAKIKNKSTSIKEKKRLALEAAKLVLPIWEVYYKDDRPRLTIQAAEEYLDNPTGENRKKAKEVVDDAYVAAIYAHGTTAAYAAYAACSAALSIVYDDVYNDAVSYALGATKEFFKIEESLNEIMFTNFQKENFDKIWVKLKENLQPLHQEALGKIIKGFELIPYTKGFANAYVTKNAKATPKLANQINKFLWNKLGIKDIKFVYDPYYQTVNLAWNKLKETLFQEMIIINKVTSKTIINQWVKLIDENEDNNNYILFNFFKKYGRDPSMPLKEWLDSLPQTKLIQIYRDLINFEIKPIQETGDLSSQTYSYYLFSQEDEEGLNYFIYKFSSSKHQYFVGISEITPGSYELEFQTEGESGLETNENEIFKIMGTIVKIAQDFINKNDFNELVIHPIQTKGKEDSRRYNIFKRFIEKNINKFEYNILYTPQSIRILKKQNIKEKFSKEWWNDQLQLIETEHIHDINEMRIVSAPKNYFPKLEEIQAKINSNFIPIKEKKLLAIEAAKLVLPIWEVYHKDDRPRLAIQTAEEYLDNPTEENRKKTREAADDAHAAVYAAYSVANVTYAAAYSAYSAAYAAYAAFINDSAIYYTTAISYALGATKKFFKTK